MSSDSVIRAILVFLCEGGKLYTFVSERKCSDLTSKIYLTALCILQFLKTLSIVFEEDNDHPLHQFP